MILQLGKSFFILFFSCSVNLFITKNKSSNIFKFSRSPIPCGKDVILFIDKLSVFKFFKRNNSFGKVLILLLKLKLSKLKSERFLISTGISAILLYAKLSSVNFISFNPHYSYVKNLELKKIVENINSKSKNMV